jgi:hypothetical protein
MLFDLRGRGRRRTVQAIYLVLAVLMGGGLVLFGIGGNTSGGLVDALTGGSSAPDTGVFGERSKAAEQRVKTNRQDAAAWAALARAKYQEASAGGGIDASGQFTADGKVQLRGADRAWQQYLKLNPPKPDPTVAILMAQVYGPAGLNRLTDAVEAQEVVAEARSDVGSYLQLAAYAYAAGQTRKADLAGQKAISLATTDQRTQIKAQVDGLKAQAAQAAAQGATGATGAGTAP